MKIDSVVYSLHQRDDYRYLSFIVMFFITVFIVCDTTAFRMVPLFGQEVPASGLVIPFVFWMADVVAEVYGYQIVRKLIWNMIACQFLFSLIITFVLSWPSPLGNKTNIAYNIAFAHIIRTSITSCCSITSGMFTNAFLMSKMKIRMNGKNLVFRALLSSSISEFVLCFVAYTTLYVGLKNPGEIFSIILTVWLYKLIVAFPSSVFLTPTISRWLKKAERSDVYDKDISYNIFRYNFQRK